MIKDCIGAWLASAGPRPAAAAILCLGLAAGAPRPAGAAAPPVGPVPVDGPAAAAGDAGALLAGAFRDLAGMPVAPSPTSRLALLEAAPALADLLAEDRPGSLAQGVAAQLGPNASGLPWRSGASCSDASFGAWRKRPLDVNVFFTYHKTFETLTATFQDPKFRGSFGLSPTPVVSMPMMPRDRPKAFAACARGDFDPYYQQYGKLLAGLSRGKALIIRLGWEANIGSGPHPWGIDTAADVSGYIKCFRREVGIFRATVPGATIEWANAKVNKLPVAATKAYPGDDVVDVWGLHYYDRDSQFRTQAGWDAYYNSTYKGGPQGLGAWLKAASSHGKPFSVPEWGLWNESATPSRSDDTLYIQNMYNFLRSNAPKIAYDNYFNCHDYHAVYPVDSFPKASALYRKLWSSGQ